MIEKTKKPLRCAIYTRKSTEHGLELEFNSLDAQREACEAYIKSQSHEGWSTLPKRYDDAAYSGGDLDRPALQRLLGDIDAGEVNVVVVYKIDRLTRSLADFAKLVERFDGKGVSFVAVTQQFNTTTSMGRLTLNVLLSFAQFERELASERVRDKVAASRQKGKWTGGGVPLGYDVKDKKLVVNEREAKIVRTIFERYLALKCLRGLKEDLDKRGIVSKRRNDTSGRGVSGGVPFTYGPLAYLLKNRTYLGEMGHKGRWFAGEHRAIIAPTLFDAVHEVIKKNSIDRRRRQSSPPALLTGVLFDERGNRMTPSFTTKHTVRYRFYVSSAVLSGRGDQKASVRRVPAVELENSIVACLRQRFSQAGDISDQDLVSANVARITLTRGTASVKLNTGEVLAITFAWPIKTPSGARIKNGIDAKEETPDLALLNALARAHAWRKALIDGRYKSVEDLAKTVQWHPKVMRKALRLAFLAPDIVEAMIRRNHSLPLSRVQAVGDISWDNQRKLLGAAQE
jgi:DNA invertase Pin-like site-specific DNA recombinase